MIRPHLHLGPTAQPRCGAAPIPAGFHPCPGRPHPVTLPPRAGSAMSDCEPGSVAWYDARTSLWDATAGRNLLYGHPADQINPLTGQVIA